MNPHARKGTAPSRRRVCRFRHSRKTAVENISTTQEIVNNRKGFTFLEVLIAVAIAGLVFSSFLTLSSKSLDVSLKVFKTFTNTIAAHNAANEILYEGKSFNNKTVEIFKEPVNVNQDFTTVMGFRLLKVNADGVVIYEIR